MADRIISFSIKPVDIEATDAIELLKSYAKKKGFNFSFLIIEAIKLYVEKLELSK